MEEIAWQIINVYHIDALVEYARVRRAEITVLLLLIAIQD